MFHVKEAMISYREQGSLFNKFYTTYLIKGALKKDKPTINWFNIMGVIARTCVHLVTFVVHSAVLFYSTEAGINFSLIINLYSLTPFFTAIAFFCFFKERLTRIHLIGMLFIFGCVYITSQSEKPKEA